MGYKVLVHQFARNHSKRQLAMGIWLGDRKLSDLLEEEERIRKAFHETSFEELVLLEIIDRLRVSDSDRDPYP